MAQVLMFKSFLTLAFTLRRLKLEWLFLEKYIYIKCNFLQPGGSMGPRSVWQLLLNEKSENCWKLNNHSSLRKK